MLSSVLCLLTLMLAANADFKLSDSKLLLPYYSFNPVNYTIRGSNGACYEWYSGTPEVATVVPVEDSGGKCSNEAIITAVWQSPHRAVATIYAKIAGHIVKCDVIVGDISKIEISTTTQELYLHNTPESLVVNAFDEYGNTFSSLEGVPFEWHIFGDTYDGAGDGHSVLRFLTWEESEYATPATMRLLESKGIQGYMQLISGLRTGSAVVSVSLQEPVYSHIPPGQVRLLVMANAQLSPALAYLMPQARLTFRVHVVQQGNDQEVIMPSTQYHLQVNNTDLATLDSSDGCTLTALTYGQTQVILLDRNVEEALDNLNEVLHSKAPETDLLRLPKRRRPTSLIQIVEPAYLGFTLTPKYTIDELHICKRASLVNSILAGIQTTKSNSATPTRNWIMEVGKLYAISTDIYDRNNHRLYPSGNLRLDISFPNEYFEVIYASKNSTYAIVRPLLPGTISWKAKLQGLVDRNGRFISATVAVTGTQDITIHPPIQINPSKLIFPWPVDFEAPNGTSGSGGYKLIASGGCGQYRWVALPLSDVQCSNSVDCLDSEISRTSTVVSVNQNGEAQALGLGEAIIVASSYSNPELCGHITVQVRVPAQLKFIPGRAEVLIGNLPGLSKTDSLDSIITNPNDNATFSLQTSQFKWNTDGNFAVTEENLEILPIGLAVLDSEGRSMSDCRHLSITLRLFDSSIIRIVPALHPPRRLPAAEEINSTFTECLRFHVIGKQVGFTEIEASYLSGSSGTIEPLVARMTLGAYKNIAFVNPKSSISSFAVGSTREFLVTQGPQPWILLPTEHYIRVHPKLDNPDNAEIQSKTQPSQIHESHFLRVTQISLDADHSNPDSDLKSAKSRLISFSLRCESSGTFVLSVQIGNKPTTSNPIPMVLSTEFTIICDVAHSLRLIPHFPLPALPAGMPACPYQNTTSVHWSHDKLLLPNTVSSYITLVFIGSDGQELEAVDSITPVVHLLREDSTRSNQPSLLVRQSKPQIQLSSPYTTIRKSSSIKSDYVQPYFLLTPLELGSSSGLVHISVDAQPKSSRYIPFTTGRRNLQTSMNVYLSPTIQIKPSKQMRLFFHPNAESHVSVLGGSGFFHLDSLFIVKATDNNPSTTNPIDHYEDLLLIREQHDDMVEHTLPLPDFVPNRSGHVYEIRPKRVGRTILTATDLCFPALSTEQTGSHDVREPAKSDVVVDVVGVRSLVLRVRDQIELGSESTAYVEAIGTDGKILDPEFARLLKLEITSGRISTTSGETDELMTRKPVLGLPLVEMPSNTFWTLDRPNLARFPVTGLNLGSSRLQVSVTMKDGFFKEPITVRSNVVEIQVFAPLRLTPCNFNLVLGAEYEIHATGGPTQVSLEFFSSPESKSHLSILKSKQDSARIRSTGPTGLATILARAVGVLNSENATLDTLSDQDGQVFVYSETSCTIHIVALSGIRIGCPLATLIEANSHLASTAPSGLPSWNMNSDTLGERFLMACAPGSGPMCGSVPIWAEGLALTPSAANSRERLSTSVISPLGMARTSPPLRFVWRLSPPEPTPYAKLVFWLNAFGVKADETQTSSGLILVGLKPGRVTIELEVEALDPSFKQVVATSTDGKPLNRLVTQMTVVILPRLELAIPPRVHQQILMSPNSQLTLIPLLESRLHSILQYEVKNFQYSNTSSPNNWHTLSSPNLVTVTSDGVLHIGNQCSAAGLICHALVQITSCPTNELLNSPSKIGHDTLLTQTLLLEIVIKTPRYLTLSSPQIFDLSLDSISESHGLPIGGPYIMDVSYHDELGRLFDVVSDTLTLRTSLHRSDLFSIQLVRESDLESSSQTAGPTKLAIHALPSSVNRDGDFSKPISNDASSNLWTVLHLSDSARNFGLWPTYLNLPYGGSLNVMIPTTFVEGQWACLPKLPMAGTWISSEPSIVWVDNSSNTILARRQGKATLSYKLSLTKTSPTLMTVAMDNNKTGSYQSLTYLIGLSVISLVEHTQLNPKDKPQLIPIDTEQRLLTMPHVVLTSGIHQTTRTDLISYSSLRFLVQLPTLKGPDSSCAADSSAMHSNFVAMAPLHCSLGFKSASHTDLSGVQQLSFVPSWLAHLVLWERNETLDSILETNSIKLSIDRVITAQLESIPRSSSFYSRSTQWQCILRSSPDWQFKIDVIGLVMEPKTRLTLNLISRKSRDETVVLAQSEILPLLGFEMLVPPTLRIFDGNQQLTFKHVYHFRITNTDKLIRQLLVFVPPATADAMNSKELGPEKILSRSKDTSVLDIVEPIRPVRSLTEISQALNEYTDSINSDIMSSDLSQSIRSDLIQWHGKALEQIQALEDVTSTGSDQILKRGLIWTVKIRGVLNESAIHGIVPIIISFGPTGQRIEVPVHIHFPPKSYLMSGASETGKLLPASFGLTWIHLFALVLTTLILAVIVHLVVRSNVLVSSSMGSTNLRSSLPTPISPTSNDTNRSRQLWSQSLLPGSSPSKFYQKPSPYGGLRPARISPTQGQHLTNQSPNSQPILTDSIFSPGGAGGDFVNEERRWRQALNLSGSGSPSRLRTTFDNI